MKAGVVQFGLRDRGDNSEHPCLSTSPPILLPASVVSRGSSSLLLVDAGLLAPRPSCTFSLCTWIPWISRTLGPTCTRLSRSPPLSWSTPGPGRGCSAHFRVRSLKLRKGKRPAWIDPGNQARKPEPAQACPYRAWFQTQPALLSSVLHLYALPSGLAFRDPPPVGTSASALITVGAGVSVVHG